MLQEETISYKGRMTNSGNIGFAVIISMIIGMNFMFFLIALNVHVFIILLALLGSITFVLAFFIRNVQLTITSEGIQVELSPIHNMLSIISKRTRLVRWENIKSYEVGVDLNRSLKEYRFLKIWQKKGNFKININEGESYDSKNSFEHFVKALEDRIETFNQSHVHASDIQNQGKGPIRRKGDFYTTWAGKFLTLFFVIITAGLAAIMFGNGLGSGGSYFKLLFVLLPGTAYLVYRSYLKK